MWLNEMYGEGVCTQRSNLVTTMESHISGSDPSLPPVNWVTLFKMLYFSVPEFLNSSKKINLAIKIMSINIFNNIRKCLCYFS